jgi:hypothetical protein
MISAAYGTGCMDIAWSYPLPLSTSEQPLAIAMTIMLIPSSSRDYKVERLIDYFMAWKL